MTAALGVAAGAVLGVAAAYGLVRLCSALRRWLGGKPPATRGERTLGLMDKCGHGLLAVPHPSVSCPACGAGPWLPHNEGCYWLEHLAELARYTEGSELRPRFLITLAIDGDDYVPVAVVAARAQLEAALRQMAVDGWVRAYTIEVPQ